MARDKGQLDLKADIRQVLRGVLEGDPAEVDVTAVLAAALPHFELAYKRGLAAAESRAGYRVVQENERLRRELEQMKKGLA
jgi:hypothetical protein